MAVLLILHEDRIIPGLASKTVPAKQKRFRAILPPGRPSMPMLTILYFSSGLRGCVEGAAV